MGTLLDIIRRVWRLEARVEYLKAATCDKCGAEHSRVLPTDSSDLFQYDFGEYVRLYELKHSVKLNPLERLLLWLGLLR